MVDTATTPSGLSVGQHGSRPTSPPFTVARRRSGRKCFTFFEASLVIGIFMMILALVFAEISRFRTTSQRNACIMNLKQIEAAKNLWALVKKKADKKTPRDSQLLPYLGSDTMPTCPAGGTYNVRKVSQEPRCSLRKKKDHEL